MVNIPINKLYFLILLILTILVSPVSALEIDSTYGDVTSTSTQANNLINYAMSYESFKDSNYVIFNDVQYSYYIVWSDDLNLNSNNIVTATNIEYVHYYRDSTSGYSSNYVYDYGTDSSFTLSSSYVNTSNLPNYGFKSVLHSEYINFELEKNFLIMMLAFIFVIMVKNLRRD